MTTPYPDEPSTAKRRPVDAPEHGVTPVFGARALGEDGDEHVQASRAVVWLLVFVTVVIGVALYLLFAKRLSPLLG